MIKKILFGALAFLSLACSKNVFEPEIIQNNVKDSLEVIVRDTTKKDTIITKQDTTDNKTQEDTTKYELPQDTTSYEPSNPDTIIYEPSKPDTIKITTTKQNDLALQINKIERSGDYLNIDSMMQNISDYDIILNNLNVIQENISCFGYALLNERGDTLYSKQTRVPFRLRLYNHGYMRVRTNEDTTKYSFSNAYIELRSEKWGNKNVNIPYPLILTKKDISNNVIQGIDEVKYYVAKIKYSKADSLKEAIWVKKLE